MWTPLPESNSSSLSEHWAYPVGFHNASSPPLYSFALPRTTRTKQHNPLPICYFNSSGSLTSPARAAARRWRLVAVIIIDLSSGQNTRRHVQPHLLNPKFLMLERRRCRSLSFRISIPESIGGENRRKPLKWVLILIKTRAFVWLF